MMMVVVAITMVVVVEIKTVLSGPQICLKFVKKYMKFPVCEI
jgi:hypothetical protein